MPDYILETHKLTRKFKGFVIATTLGLEPELMLLDEPTQGMGREDVERVTGLIEQAAANRTVLMVKHNMNVVAGISDTITVLQRGTVLAEGSYVGSSISTWQLNQR